MAIREGYKTNFETLKAAADAGDLCIMEVYNRISGAPAVLVCATYQDDDGYINFVPLARMFDGNPYEEYVTEEAAIAKYRREGTCVVRLRDGEILDSTRDASIKKTRLANAYAVLKDHLVDEKRARSLANLFVEQILDNAPDDWTISALELDAWVMQAEGKHIDENTIEGLRAVHSGQGGSPTSRLVNAFGQPISSGKTS